MHTISPAKIEGIIRHVVLKMREPVIFIGPSGAGKTAVVDQAAERLGALCHHTLLGQYDTVDMKGTPWVSDGADGYQSTVWHPASTLPFKGNPRFPTDKPIILFLDELTSATVPVMGVCYQLVNERRVGEHELMDNVYIVCAGNRESDKGIVNRMPMPLCNRMTWYEVGVDADALCYHGQERGWSPVTLAFLQFRKVLVHTFDPAKPDKTFASPRTWEKADAYFRDDMPIDIKQASMAGAVGDGPAAEFWGFNDSWMEIAKLMPSIRKDPLTAKVPESAALRYAVTVACSGEMSKATTTTYAPYLLRLDPEFAVLAWQLGVRRDKDLLKTLEFSTFVKKYKTLWG